MKFIKLLLIAGFLLGPIVSKAQYYEPEKKEEAKTIKEVPTKDRFHFGGSLSLQFGSYTSVYISPIVYYDVAKNFMLGAGFNYIFQKYDWYGEEYRSSIYGPKFAAIFNPIKQLIISSEFEYNYYDRDYDNYGSYHEAYWQPTWYVGLGYRVPMGKRGGMYISFSYDLLYDSQFSYYANAWRPTIGVYF
jgi:hypothetical protein